MNQKIFQFIRSSAPWRRATQIAVLLGFAGCGSEAGGSEAGGSEADLPPGWEGAERIENLTQEPCDHESGWEVLSEIDVNENDRGVGIVYDHARFRCMQPVEAFARKEHASIDVLLQPVDMNPSSAAKCDCFYRITLDVPAPAGAYAFTLYRRDDNIGGPHSPEEVGHGDVSVP